MRIVAKIPDRITMEKQIAAQIIANWADVKWRVCAAASLLMLVCASAMLAMFYDAD